MAVGSLGRLGVQWAPWATFSNFRARGPEAAGDPLCQQGAIHSPHPTQPGPLGRTDTHRLPRDVTTGASGSFKGSLWLEVRPSAPSSSQPLGHSDIKTRPPPTRGLAVDSPGLLPRGGGCWSAGERPERASGACGSSSSRLLHKP